MKRDFRPDIEGLRAFAILPILLFHLDPSLCPGGYIGVDIFFVISGFLITRMILQQGADFRFRSFYLRRIYRLLPALMVTLGATLIAGWWILGPRDYVEVAKSSLFAAFGLSNFFFYSAVDYFNSDSYAHPLLHTWSLGVEEQFYLFWPALLVLFMRQRLSWLWSAIGVLLVFSFAAVTFVRPEAPQLVFYLMPFRVFEFAIGAGLVLVFPFKDKVPLRFQTFGAIAAFASLIGCSFLLDEQTAWPSLWSLIPCLATAILILTGDSTPIRTVLINPIVRFFGQISYSLYLVHWPLITLYRTYKITEPTSIELVFLAVMSIMLATILYLCVERTFRVQKHGIPPRGEESSRAQLARLSLPETVKPVATLAIFSSFLITAVTVFVANGFPSRIDKTRAQFLDKGLSFAGDLCSQKRSRCVFGDRSSSRKVFVVGDSHALNLIYGLDKLFRHQNIKGIALYDNGCIHLYGTKRFINGTGDEGCRRNIAFAYDYVADQMEPVILVSSFASGRNEIGAAGGDAPLEQTSDQYLLWLEERLFESLKVLQADKRPVILFKQMYSTGVNLPKCLAQPVFQNQSDSDAAKRCAPMSLTQTQELYDPYDRIADNVAAKFSKVITIDPKHIFCNSQECATGTPKDGLYFRDPSHLTNAGSKFLIDQARDRLLESFSLR